METLGPGTYSPDRADAITRVKTTNINMGSSPSRASLTRKTGAVDVGPGQYDGFKQFGEETKTFTIGEKREGKIVETTIGPGQYSPERSEMITRSRVQVTNIASSTGHGTIIEKTSGVAPGQYEDRSHEISQSNKGFTIGEKRFERTEMT